MTNNGTSNGVSPKPGVQERVNFGKIRLAGHYPDLLEIQLKSFQEYFQLETTPENRINEGLYRVFQKFSYHRCQEYFQPGISGLFH